MSFDVLNPTLDFNNDGRADIYWRNNLLNLNTIWFANGAQIIGSSSLPDTAEEAGWRDPKFGDFDGNGTTDFFWHNSITGSNVVWLMNGGRIQGGGVLAPTSSDWSYKMVDFNGDQTTDILWHSQTTGEVVSWTFSQGTPIAGNLIGVVPPEWEAYVADFNNDRRTDLFWHNEASGSAAVWEMSGATIIANTPVTGRPVGWRPTIGDFNGDGDSDVFWQNPTTGANQVSLWSTFSDSFFTTVEFPTTRVTPSNLPGAAVQFDIASFGGQDFIIVLDSLSRTYSVWSVSFTTPSVNNQQANGSLLGVSLDFSDFNGDGNEDILGFSILDKRVVIIEASGNNSQFFFDFPSFGWSPIVQG